MTFLFPMMLGGLALVAVPLLLHLITRRKPKTLPFPAFRFLVQRRRPQGHRAAETAAGQRASHRPAARGLRPFPTAVREEREACGSGDAPAAPAVVRLLRPHRRLLGDEARPRPARQARRCTAA